MERIKVMRKDCAQLAEEKVAIAQQVRRARLSRLRDCCYDEEDVAAAASLLCDVLRGTSNYIYRTTYDTWTLE